MQGTPFQKQCWEMLILDAWPDVLTMDSLAAGDVDGDGNVEVIAGGHGRLFWYRPATNEKGAIAAGQFVVGLALGDIDGDGLPEVVVGGEADGNAYIRWYQPEDNNASGRWVGHDLDPACTGGAHDLLFADIDNDGRCELLANAIGRRPGLFIYKPQSDRKAPWNKYVISTEVFEEGLAAADLDGDGRIEVIHGPDLYFPPDAGVLDGPWQRRTYAENFREMVRVAAVDITGNGRCDIVVAESEYLDGRLSWFENRLVEESRRQWIEHPVDNRLYYAHSLDAGRDTQGNVRIFLAEMAEGGWNAPRNRDARIMAYITSDRGATWQREMICRGSGSHQAFPMDIDGDGREEIVGKQWKRPRLHLLKKKTKPCNLRNFQHSFIDRDKPSPATDIVAADIDGDGLTDIACGQWWYRNPGWERYDLPGFEVFNAHDIDGDGRKELLAAKRAEGRSGWYEGLSSDLYWLKPINPLDGEWEEHPIGKGSGDWPHGSVIGPVGPGGRLAVIAGYHSAQREGDRPEMFTAPDSLHNGTWERTTLADIPYGEEMLIRDVTGNGRADIIAGPWWLENSGEGRFQPHLMVEDFEVARVAAADINGNGTMDVIVGEEVLADESGQVPHSRLAWLEQPADPRKPWPVHVIDALRCPHSIGAADLDGDGNIEIVAGEHDPTWPYRSRCRMMIYKKADPRGLSWWRYVIDDRFEHHDGCRIVELSPGRPVILSHGWTDSKYVHIYQR